METIANLNKVAKTYTKKFIAAGVASKLTKAKGTRHIYEQIGDVWVVGTHDEIQALIAMALEAGKNPADTKEEVIKDGVVVADKPAKVKAPKQVPMVEATFTFVKEDEKYVTVELEGKKYSIAKSRITYEVKGNEVVVTMTAKYAAHRPELKVA